METCFYLKLQATLLLGTEHSSIEFKLLLSMLLHSLPLRILGLWAKEGVVDAAIYDKQSVQYTLFTLEASCISFSQY